MPASAQVNNLNNMYTISSEQSLLLPSFDTSAVAGSDITNIVLSLNVRNVAIEGNSRQLQFTVNIYNTDTNEAAVGISFFCHTKAW